MARPARPFSIYKRPTTKKNRFVYYTRIRNPITGTYAQTVSTGQTSRARAEEWTREYIAEKERKAEAIALETQRITVRELAAGFWDINGEYAESRRARGYSISHGHLDGSESYTRNHIIPAWGNQQVADITTGAVDRWILDLHRQGKLAGATINKILQILRSILDVAVSRGYIRENPASFVKPVRAVHQKRGVLTDDEVRRLLIWPGPFDDYRHYALNVLAFATGARLGEIRGLTVDHVFPDRVEIVQSWEEGHGLKPPKYNSVRAVPISPRVWETMERVIEETCPVSLIFYSTTDISKPMSKSYIEDRLRQAIVNMMLPEEDRTNKEKRKEAFEDVKARRVTPHSWRHKLNSVLRSAGVPDSKIRLLTGHRGEAMTDWYTHYAAADFTDVLNAAGNVLQIATTSSPSSHIDEVAS